MDFSYRFKNYLNNFVGRSATLSNYTPNVNEACPIFISFSLDENLCGEVPTCISSLIYSNLMGEQHNRDIICPLSIELDSNSPSSSDTILRELSYCPYRGGRIWKITTNKGEVYYGAPGVVFNKNLNPLLYITSVVNRSIENNNTIIKWSTPIVHISPLLFTDGTDILSKAIVKKWLNFFLTNEVYYNGLYKKVSIVIDDGTKFFRTPNEPDLSFSNEKCYTILLDNLREIVQQV